MKELKLSDIIDAISIVAGDMYFTYYLDPDTYKLIYTNEMADSHSDILDDANNYICLPTRYDINPYHMMEEFIDTIKDKNLASKLFIAIKGKGAFRRFKNICIYNHIIDKWYKFQEMKYEEIAIEWCKHYQIKYIK